MLNIKDGFRRGFFHGYFNDIMSLHGQQRGNEEMVNLIGQAQELSALVSYQDGAVVSKEIIKKKEGTVTVFAFDKGQGLSEHTAPFDALVYVVDGKVEITIDGKPSNLKAGDMVIMPANKPHALKAIEQFKMMLIMIRVASL
jgi:quercetin dioxygenase-like cupin family protein